MDKGKGCDNFAPLAWLVSLQTKYRILKTWISGWKSMPPLSERQHRTMIFGVSSSDFYISQFMTLHSGM